MENVSVEHRTSAGRPPVTARQTKPLTETLETAYPRSARWNANNCHFVIRVGVRFPDRVSGFQTRLFTKVHKPGPNSVPSCLGEHHSASDNGETALFPDKKNSAISSTYRDNTS
jgi:hypothetical protein